MCFKGNKVVKQGTWLITGYGEEEAPSAFGIFRSGGSSPVSITSAPHGRKFGTPHGLWRQTDVIGILAFHILALSLGRLLWLSPSILICKVEMVTPVSEGCCQDYVGRCVGNGQHVPGGIITK